MGPPSRYYFGQVSPWKTQKSKYGTYREKKECILFRFWMRHKNNVWDFWNACRSELSYTPDPGIFPTCVNCLSICHVRCQLAQYARQLSPCPGCIRRQSNKKKSPRHYYFPKTLRSHYESHRHSPSLQRRLPRCPSRFRCSQSPIGWLCSFPVWPFHLPTCRPKWSSPHFFISK